MSVDCDLHHRPIWEAIEKIKGKANQLPLWAKICGAVLAVIVAPTSISLGGWALCKCDTLGERVRAVEVKSDSTEDMLKEIRGDVKKLLEK